MKNIALSLFLVLFVSACSSGTTVADTPFNITGLFQGVYQNSTGARTGSFLLNIVEDDSGTVTGNLIFDEDGSGCTFNGTITGSTSGFSAALTLDIATGEFIEETVEETVETVDDVTGVVTSTVVENIVLVAVEGQTIYQLTQSNTGNSLTGTYTSADIPDCSNASGSGTVSITRI